ncbi:MAG TPA: MutL protein [Armatimonadetes bacterium]|nr:MutL protein [Armatimonadota bacterium]
MALALLLDLGSTYTKAVAVDLTQERVVARAQAVTTANCDVRRGAQQALKALRAQLGSVSFTLKRACSSAAGGLRLVAIGLTPELTAEAAKQAALGAGARVLEVFSYRLTQPDLRRLHAHEPDLLLLAGGTDGGDTETILHNARALANTDLTGPVIVAGNREAAAEVEAILTAGGKTVFLVENVLPTLDCLNVEPAREQIRETFALHLVQAKGLDAVQAFVGEVVMPTPAAVLRAAQLLAEGTTEEPGWGELLVVDVGGATTDVHSVAEGRPTQPQAVSRGLPEPRMKRTVEGDLGLRVSAPSLVEAVGAEYVLRKAGLPLDSFEAHDYAKRLAAEVGKIPATPEERAFDEGLARVAVEQAVERHVGTLEPIPTPTGTVFVQRGKDLSLLPTVVGTGGIFAHSPAPEAILREALASPDQPWSLKPRSPRLLIDRRYVLWALGLLSISHPETALRIMKRNLKPNSP